MPRLLFASLAVSFLLFGIAKADDQSAARAILDKAIAAQGGEAAASKIVALHWKEKCADFDGDTKIPAHSESYLEGFDKVRQTTTDDETKERQVLVIDGKHGWIKEGTDEAETLSEEQVAFFHESMYADWITLLVPLKAAEYRLSPLNEINVAGHPAVGILVRHDKHEAIKLYFDKQSHLLVHRERRFMDVDSKQEVKEEVNWSDFRAIHGVKMAFKSETIEDGTKMTEDETTSIEFLEKPLDAKLFVKP